MTTVSLIDRPHGLLHRYSWRYSRKKFGRVVDPLRGIAHHRGVLLSNGILEMVVDKGWRRLDPSLRWLVLQATSGQVGCSWCIDYGYYEGQQQGVDPRKVRDVPRWRESDAFTADERLVLEYAEAASATPAVISEDLVRRLRATFDEAELVELVGWVALENFRSRVNAGLGVRSEGFSEACDVVPISA